MRALRRAAAIDRDNREYQLALAGALAAADDHEAARQVLQRLRDTAPEDAEVNLELARLESRNGDVTGAVRYYQNALYGNGAADRQTPVATSGSSWSASSWRTISGAARCRSC